MKRLMLFSFLMLLVSAATVKADVVRFSDCLPPIDTEYLSRFRPPPPHQIWRTPNGEIIFSVPRHGIDRLATCTPPPSTPGATTIDEFGSILRGQLTMGGMSFQLEAPAQVGVNVTFARQEGNVRFFLTEMIQLDVSGGNLPPGVLLRESTTQRSLGVTTIESLADGSFLINSFFDVWTDLSLDGGVTWTTSDVPGAVEAMEAIPEPVSLSLLALGSGGLALLSRRRRRS